ncbi:hypothetical protein L2E82_30683 [Cichorium intybus]|uniref:Uncharacterized protein n=1 Tax=Cichorium intybus TaxID=13427 RepID=A0ACB9D0Y4_CICIN|nr:hypothetical protein L2E82_30683 [Cichorium intybus]
MIINAFIISVLILDEADRILDAGFKKEVNAIINFQFILKFERWMLMSHCSFLINRLWHRFYIQMFSKHTKGYIVSIRQDYTKDFTNKDLSKRFSLIN